ncbi:hypothetical protein OAP51_04050 [Alphaproteobacteria bacterium]|nr:hypothetical protein [Alphaproteobacteria bacterium]
MIQIFIVASFLMLISQNAMAFCSEPSAPWGKPVKPSVPYCVNEWDRTHTCDDWEIDNYNAALESYNYEVQSYIRQLNDYIDEAAEYAQCEVNNLE